MGEPSHPGQGLFPLHASPPSGHERLAASLAMQLSRAVRTLDFDIDLLDCCARFPDGAEAHFTPRQWQLLQLLLDAAGRPVTRADLASQLFGDDAPEEGHQVPVLILQLRRKLEPEPRSPQYVRSLDAETYLFDPEGRSHSRPLGSLPYS